MSLLENPFFVIEATSLDDKPRLLELAEDMMLIKDPEKCNEARNILFNPRKRISAEIAWLTGISNELVSECINMLSADPDGIVTYKNSFRKLSYTNLLAQRILCLEDDVTSDIVLKWITEISSQFESITANEVLNDLNNDRLQSKFPQISDMSIIEEELRQRRIYYCSVIKEALNKMNPKELVQTVTMVVDKATKQGEKHAPILIDDLVDSYEIEVQEFMTKEGNNISEIIKIIASNVEKGKEEKFIKKMIDELEKVIKNWDFVAQPIQLSTKSRGLKHEASRAVALETRELSIKLFNDHDMLESAQKINTLLGKVFAEVNDISQMADDDKTKLEEISIQAEGMKAESARNNEKWKRDITYETSVGWLNSKILRISPDGVYWDGKNWPLDDITAVRWGVDEVNRNYIIMVGASNKKMEIPLKDYKVFNSFTTRIWRAVCVRLLISLIQRLERGEGCSFGSIYINNDGIIFGNDRTNPKNVCIWPLVSIFSESNSLHIKSLMNPLQRVSLDYILVDNLHILEFIIRTIKEKSLYSASDLLRG